MLQFIMIEYLTQGLNKHEVTHYFQLKLSEILEKSPFDYCFQSDGTIITMKEDSGVNIYFTDPNFTNIQNSLAIEYVKSVRDIRVKPMTVRKQAIIVYKIDEYLHYYSGKVPMEVTNIRSGLPSSQSARVEVGSQFQILEISQIFQTPQMQTNCIITTVDGRVLLLRYNSIVHRMSLRQIKRESWKITKIFKSAMKSWKSQSGKEYRKCASCLRLSIHDNNQYLFGLFLLDDLLMMKYFKIANEPNSQIIQPLSSWQANIKQHFNNQTIINSQLVFNKGSADKFTASLFIVYSNAQHNVSLKKLNIDFNGNIEVTLLKQNILQIHNQLEQFNQYNEIIKYNQFTDFVQMGYSTDHLNIVFNRNISYSNSMLSNNYLFVVGDGSTVKSYPIGNSNSVIKLLKLRDSDLNQEQKKFRKMLLVGQVKCLQIDRLDNYSTQQKNNGKLTSSKTNSRLTNLYNFTENRSSLPPIPNYQQSENIDTNERRSFKYEQYGSLKSDPNRQYQNPFSQAKFQNMINKKEFNKIFELLSLQTKIFEQQLKAKKTKDNEFPHRVSDQLVILILLSLFKKHNQVQIQIQMQEQINKQLIYQILVTKFDENVGKAQSQVQIKLLQLFKNKNIQVLIQVIQIFFKSKYYSPIYNVCVQVIPNFIQKIITHIEADETEMRDENMPVEEYHKNRLAILEQIGIAYLNIYQKLINILLQRDNSFYQQGAAKGNPFYPQNVSIFLQPRPQYHLKQMLDKYLKVKKKIDETQLNSPIMNDLFELFLKKDPKNGLILYELACKHKILSLFDFLIKKRLVSKQQIQDFVTLDQIKQRGQQIYRLFLNMINTQMNDTSTSDPNELKCLESLVFFPRQYGHRLYKHLMNTYPKAAIIYGLTIKTRRQVYNDIKNSNQLKLFNKIKSPQIIISLYEPFYNCEDKEATQIKLNVDLAKLYQSLSTQFVPLAQLHNINENRNGNENKIENENENQKGIEAQPQQQNQQMKEQKYMLQVSNQQWEYFKFRVSKYLPEEQLKDIQNKFNIS